MIASRDTSFPRLWFFTADADLSYEVDTDKVIDYIDATLSDSRGWKSKGYNFYNVTAEEGKKMRKNKNNWPFVFHIRLSTSRTIERTCGFSTLSCAHMGTNIIYFDEERWHFGSIESKLPIHEYRVYLINHEVGHLLGRDHETCSKILTDKCPIMYQQTISKGCCMANVYPLEFE